MGNISSSISLKNGYYSSNDYLSSLTPVLDKSVGLERSSSFLNIINKLNFSNI